MAHLFYIMEWEEWNLMLVNCFVKLTDRFTSKLTAITEDFKNIKSQSRNIIYCRSTWKMSCLSFKGLLYTSRQMRYLLKHIYSKTIAAWSKNMWLAQEKLTRWVWGFSGSCHPPLAVVSKMHKQEISRTKTTNDNFHYQLKKMTCSIVFVMLFFFSDCLQLFQYPPTDLSAIPTSREVQRQKPQAR